MEIAKLKRDMPNTTMVYVTHDQVEAMTLADRIVVLQAGRVEQVGTPMELYEKPGNTFVAGFIGSPKMNLITGAPAERLKCKTLGVRPEHLEIVARASAGTITGSVEYTEVLGSDSFIYVKTDHGIITARENGSTTVKNGDKVNLKAVEGRTHRFDDNGKRIEGK
jgi:multiple sugar transport system ATP-binding protein